ncbi:hypothetical protein BG000_000433 [Podila horticola]|nr:hypothetical protein BG000_000433 [Podila horticola]
MEDYYDLDTILAKDEVRPTPLLVLVYLSLWKIRVHVDLITPKIFSGKVRADDQGLEMILNSSFKERLTATMDIALFGNRLEQTELSGKLDATEKKSICNTSDRSPSSHLLA